VLGAQARAAVQEALVQVAQAVQARAALAPVLAAEPEQVEALVVRALPEPARAAVLEALVQVAQAVQVRAAPVLPQAQGPARQVAVASPIPQRCLPSMRSCGVRRRRTGTR
jgi:hypothetical protein